MDRKASLQLFLFPRELRVPMNQKEWRGEPSESVLGFYGVELQSHSALAVGAFIGLFAVLQVVVAERPPSTKFVIVLPVVMAALIFVVVYSVLRLFVYGALANALLSVSMEGCGSQKEVHDRAGEFYLKNYKSWWRRVVYGGEKPTGWKPKGRWWRVIWFGYFQPRPIVLLIIFMAAWGISYWLIV